MEIRLLKYFWTVAEVGTVSGAAEVLHITQPTLSRQLQALADELDTPLFVREHNRLVLTKAGVFLKSRAAEILALTQQTEQEFIDQKHAAISGNLRIGCVEADNSDTMAEILEELVQDNPAVTFTVITGDGAQISEQLDKGLLDVAILIEPIDTAKYNTLRLPRAERWGILTSAQSPLARKQEIHPADLQGVPLMLSHRPLVEAMLNEWAGTNAGQLRVVGRYNLNFNIQPLIERQIGSALSIQGVTQDIDPSKLKFVPLAPALTTHCVLTWRKERVVTPLVSEYLRRFQAAFAN